MEGLAILIINIFPRFHKISASSFNFSIMYSTSNEMETDSFYTIINICLILSEMAAVAWQKLTVMLCG